MGLCTSKADLQRIIDEQKDIVAGHAQAFADQEADHELLTMQMQTNHRDILTYNDARNDARNVAQINQLVYCHQQEIARNNARHQQKTAQGVVMVEGYLSTLKRTLDGQNEQYVA
jgi:hypothetical protein